MRPRLPLLLLAILPLVLAGCETPPQVTRRAVMPNKTTSPPAKASRPAIPPIDVQAPTRLETATFGMG
jgi:hypothetical protein